MMARENRHALDKKQGPKRVLTCKSVNAREQAHKLRKNKAIPMRIRERAAGDDLSLQTTKSRAAHH